MTEMNQADLELARNMRAADGGDIRTRQEGYVRVNRADPIRAYEKELRTARLWAYLMGSLHACSQFLAFCNLTWATVVLLGAFVQYLVPYDYSLVVCLLLLEGTRLSSASFFTRILCRALAFRSQDPKRIIHSKDDHYPRAQWARLCSSLLQALFVIPGVILASLRLFFSNLSNYKFVPALNVQKSLCIFYSSILLNSFVGFIHLVCSAIAAIILRKNPPTEQSILRYFDHVLQNAMDFGLVQADGFEFFEFAFRMLASEFERNVQPEAVAKNHKQLVQYMYAHRLGVDFVQIYLNKDDAFLQLAAVNMVGFWADKVWGVGVPKLRLTEELLTKLADKVGTGQVGWAATTSVGAVAASSPQGAEIVARTCTSGGLSLPDRLANLVDDSSSRSLSLVRTLVLFYEHLCMGKEAAPMPFTRVDTNLVPKLMKLAETADRHRLRVQAAYLLRLMDKPCNPDVIRNIEPTCDDYWFTSEVSMLQMLREVIRDPPYVFHDRDRPAIRKDHSIHPPAWAQKETLPPPIDRHIMNYTCRRLKRVQSV